MKDIDHEVSGLYRTGTSGTVKSPVITKSLYSVC